MCASVLERVPPDAGVILYVTQRQHLRLAGGTLSGNVVFGGICAGYRVLSVCCVRENVRVAGPGVDEVPDVHLVVACHYIIQSAVGGVHTRTFFAVSGALRSVDCPLANCRGLEDTGGYVTWDKGWGPWLLAMVDVGVSVMMLDYRRCSHVRWWKVVWYPFSWEWAAREMSLRWDSGVTADGDAIGTQGMSLLVAIKTDPDRAEFLVETQEPGMTVLLLRHLAAGRGAWLQR